MDKKSKFSLPPKKKEEDEDENENDEIDDMIAE